MDRALVDGFLRRLCEEIGAPAVALDQAGEVGLSGKIEGREMLVTVALREEEELVALYSPVGRGLEGEPGAMLCEALLGLNLSAKDTAGLSFARDPREGTILLTGAVLGPEARYEAFRAVFLRLFALSAAWQERLGALEEIGLSS